MKTYILIALLLAALIISGCSEPTMPSHYSNQVVVNAFLFAEKRIDSVHIARTAQVLEFYSEDAVAISNAIVKISLMSITQPTTAETTYVLLHDSLRRGRYSSPAIVLPNRAYQISIQVPGYPEVTGSTFVPDTFSAMTSADSIVLWNPDAPPLMSVWTSSRNHVDYIPSVTSIDTLAPLIDDFRSNYRDPKEPPPDRTGFIFNIPERNSMTVPWYIFSYLGKHRLSVSAVDQNYYDFLRQLMSQSGTGPSEIRYNLNGGIGVFGSAAIGHYPFEITLIQ